MPSKCNCHKCRHKKKPKRSVIEKPKKIKKEPIDQIIYDREKKERNPPPSFLSYILPYSKFV